MQFYAAQRPCLRMEGGGVAYRKSGPRPLFRAFQLWLVRTARPAKTAKNLCCARPFPGDPLRTGRISRFSVACGQKVALQNLRRRGRRRFAAGRDAGIPACCEGEGPAKPAPPGALRAPAAAPRVFPPAFLFAYGESRGPWPRPPAAHTSPSSGISLRYRKERKSPAP